MQRILCCSTAFVVACGATELYPEPLGLDDAGIDGGGRADANVLNDSGTTDGSISDASAGDGGSSLKDGSSPSDANVLSDGSSSDASSGDGGGGDANPTDANIGDADSPDSGVDAAAADAGPADTGPAPSCTDGTRNGNETDTDCGGICAQKCADALLCSVAADCQSGVCTGGTCAAPSCNDTTKNGAETDTDCGGGTCNACAPTQACVATSDCTSNICAGNICGALPTSCHALHAASPALPSGVYPMDIGGTTFNVYCDMTTDGGGWTQVYDQDVNVAPGYQPKASWLAGLNVTAPNGGQYSILHKLAALKVGANFEFWLDWQKGAGADFLRWKQPENPTTLTGNAAATLSDISMSPANQKGCGAFAGLGVANAGSAALEGDASGSCWWFAVGSSARYGSGLPAYSSSASGQLSTTRTRLWLR